MKRIFSMCVAVVLVLGMMGAAFAETDIYGKWNWYVNQDLWRDGMKTEINPDGLPFEAEEYVSYRTDDGVKMGRLGTKFGEGNRNAADWLRAVAENIPMDYEQYSVMCYLAQQDIYAADTCFLDSGLRAWEIGEETILEELYRLRVSIDGGAGEYEIMVLMVSENDMSEFVESVMVSHSGSGAEYCENEQNYANGMMLQVVNCENWVSLRAYADTSSARLAKVPKGTVIEEWDFWNEEFAICSYNGAYGYILWDYLEYVY